ADLWGPRTAPGGAGAALPEAGLLREQDRRLLPTRRRSDDDGVDPVRRVEPCEAFRQERLFAEAGECLGPVGAEPLPATRSGEDGARAHPEALRASVFGAGVGGGFRAARLPPAGVAGCFRR